MSDEANKYTKKMEEARVQNQAKAKEMCTELVKKRFGPYRKPTEVTIPKYTAIQEKCLELALLIDELCPPSAEKATSLTLLTQVKMSANAAVAIYTE